MPYQDHCPFCSPQKDPLQNIIFENSTCYFLQHDKEQDVLEGCGVIVPKAHHSDAFHLTEEEWKDTYELLQKAKDYLDKKYAPDGYTLGWNVGKLQINPFFTAICTSYPDIMMNHTQEKGSGIG